MATLTKNNRCSHCKNVNFSKCGKCGKNVCGGCISMHYSKRHSKKDRYPYRNYGDRLEKQKFTALKLTPRNLTINVKKYF